MSIDLEGTLRRALSKLETERRGIEQQITAVRQALDVTAPSANGPSTTAAKAVRRGRRRMSLAQRRAVSARMKAYWSKRRGESKAKIGTKPK